MNENQNKASASTLLIDSLGPDLDYIQLTKNGVVISKKSMVKNSKNILMGKSVIGESCIIRGDLGVIQANDLVILGDRVVLHPSYSLKKK
jgi:hypothetical protein